MIKMLTFMLLILNKTTSHDLMYFFLSKTKITILIFIIF